MATICVTLMLGVTSYEYKILISDIISNYVMYPVFLVESLLYIPMHLYLLWLWFSKDQLGTIVNKLICIQTLCGILLNLGRIIDYYLRLSREHPSTMLPSTYSTWWLVFYYMLVYMYLTSHLSMAIIRWVCLKYPLEFHGR